MADYAHMTNGEVLFESYGSKTEEVLPQQDEPDAEVDVDDRDEEAENGLEDMDDFDVADIEDEVMDEEMHAMSDLELMEE